MVTFALAVLAACANAMASVLQRKANREVSTVDSLSPRLLAELLRKPLWFAGVGGIVVGFLLQALALHNGELSVVEPILVCELPFTLLLAARVFRTPLEFRSWAASLGMAAGLAALLYFLAPSPGHPTHVSGIGWTVGIAGNLAVVALTVRSAHRDRPEGPAHRSSRRAAAFGMAAGCQFGMTAALIKGAMVRLNDGWATMLTGWELYAMIASGLLGVFLMQSAMHAGSLVFAQPGLTLADPLVSILWGTLVFGEGVRTGFALLPALAGALLMALSVVVLARSPVLRCEPPTRGGSSGAVGP